LKRLLGGPAFQKRFAAGDCFFDEPVGKLAFTFLDWEKGKIVARFSEEFL
jgi:hypothetical protein